MMPIWNSVAVLGLMFVLKWRLRPHAWFWITMAVIAALHVPLILFVPWGTTWSPPGDRRHRLRGFFPDPLDSFFVGKLVEGPKGAEG